MSNDKYIELAKKIILKHLDLNEFAVFLFGSRAYGTAQFSSDIDVGILGKKAIDPKILTALKSELESSSVPFKVELVDFNSVESKFKRIALQKVKVWNKPKHIKLS